MDLLAFLAAAKIVLPRLRLRLVLDAALLFSGRDKAVLLIDEISNVIEWLNECPHFTFIQPKYSRPEEDHHQ